jgi:hypothetical protein
VLTDCHLLSRARWVTLTNFPVFKCFFCKNTHCLLIYIKVQVAHD